MNSFDVNEVARKLLSLLKDKFPAVDWKQFEADSDLETIGDALFYSKDAQTANVMLNWLLSLGDEDVSVFCENEGVRFDEGRFDGAAKALFDRIDERKEKFREELRQYEDGVKLYNKTAPIKADSLTLLPMTSEASAFLLKALKTDPAPNAYDFFYSFLHFNFPFAAHFTVHNEQKELVGFVSLTEIQEPIVCIPMVNTCNLSYYTLPDHRGKKYAQTAARALIKAAFDGRIQMERNGESYGEKYGFVTLPLDVKLIKVLVNSDNAASLKTARQLGFSDCGSIFSVSEDGSVSEHRNFILFNPSVKRQ